MEVFRNNETGESSSAGLASAQQQFALFDLLISGFSLFLNTVQSSLGIDLRIYVPLLLTIGSAAWAWSHIWDYIKNGFNEYLMSSVSIRTDDEVFNMVMDWVAQQNFSRGSNRVIANTNIGSRSWALWRSAMEQDEDRNETRDEDDHGYKERKENTSELKYTPSYGTSFFTYRGRLVLFIRSEDTSRTRSNLSASECKEIRISCFGRNPAVLKELLVEARQMFLSKDQSKTIIFRPTGTKDDDPPNWRRCVVARFSRPFSTIVLDKTMKQRLIDDVADYVRPETRRWYANRGIPYRRGYLFYGPPGTGKSSLSFALAGFFKMPIYIISLSSRVASEDNVSMLFTQLPQRCIVLLEDIDSAGLTHTRAGKDSQSADQRFSPGGKRLSLPGLLNVLDGVASQEGRVLIMTSNHLEKLDPALTRPGRVDLMVKFTRADRDAAASIFRAVYTPNEREIRTSTGDLEAPIIAVAHGDEVKDKGDEKASTQRTQEIANIEDLAVDFATRIPHEEFSPAEIHGLLLQHKCNPSAAIQAVDGWIKATRKERANERDREVEELRKKEKENFT